MLPSKNETVLECHAPLKEKLTIRPTSLKNKSHQSLTMSVHARRNRSSHALKEYISAEDALMAKERHGKVCIIYLTIIIL